MFQFLRLVAAPELNRIGHFSQVVDVPTRRTALLQMVIDTGIQTTGAESTANVSIISLREFEGTQFPDLNQIAAGYIQNQDIGSLITSGRIFAAVLHS